MLRFKSLDVARDEIHYALFDASVLLTALSQLIRTSEIFLSNDDKELLKDCTSVSASCALLACATDKRDGEK